MSTTPARNDVVHVTTVHPWWDNRIFEKMVSMLPSRGWSVTYIAPNPDTQFPATAGVRFIRLVPGGGLIGRIRRNFVAFANCLRQQRQLVHFHDPEFMPFGIVLKILGYRVIYDVHEDNLLGIRQKAHIPWVLRSVLAYFVASLEAIAARILTIIIAERAYAKRFKHGVTIFNYMKADDFGAASTDEPGGQSINLGEKKRMIYTGSISEDRGALIHVELLRRLIHYDLYMVGRCSNELKEELYRCAGDARDRLHLVVSESGIPFPEIEKYYRMGGWKWALAVFPLTPHYFEKELTKFFEYMFYRIPIVCSDFPVWRSLIERNEAGIVVSESDYENAVERILESEGAFRHYRKKAWGLDKQLSWEEQLDKLCSLYSLEKFKQENRW